LFGVDVPEVGTGNESDAPFVNVGGSGKATAKAREMVERMRRKGDHEGADTWLRIIVAIGELGEPPTGHGTS